MHNLFWDSKECGNKRKMGGGCAQARMLQASPAVFPLSVTAQSSEHAAKAESVKHHLHGLVMRWMAACNRGQDLSAAQFVRLNAALWMMLEKREVVHMCALQVRSRDDCVEELIVAVQNLVDGYLSGPQGYPPALDGLRRFRFEIGQGPCDVIEMRLAEVRAQLNTELWKVMPGR
jgi:hypothetical protein